MSRCKDFILTAKKESAKAVGPELRIQKRVKGAEILSPLADRDEAYKPRPNDQSESFVHQHVSDIASDYNTY